MSERVSFFRLLVGFLLGATGVHGSCPIELSPPGAVLKYGESVSINCSTLESKFEGMGWEATQGGTGLEKVNHLTWTVERLTDWNISPSCFFTPSLDSPIKQCSEMPKIVLYTFPETISMSSTSGSSGIMIEAEKSYITCDIHNIAPIQNLTVRWYKGDTIIKTETFNNSTKEPVNLSLVLPFTPTRHDNGVVFRCEAQLDLRPEVPQLTVFSNEYNIRVYFGPDLQCSAPELLEGDSLGKHCPVIGNPVPFVEWQKDGQRIDPTLPLNRTNAGLYTVKAEGASAIKEEIYVLVLYGPELKCPSTYTAQEYTPFNFNCPVDSYPESEVIWKKDEEEVELPETLTRSDSGLYLITASNKQSNQTAQHTVEIIVTYPPSEIVELEDTEVDVGSTMRLKCSSTGNPRPTYSWDYYQTANVMEKNEDGVSSLIIHNATAHNTGSYRCHAQNIIGIVSKTVRVTVKGAQQECPIEITPDRMVIQYQSGGLNATCKPTSTGSRNIRGETYWQYQGTITSGPSWLVDTYKDWDRRPACAAKFEGIGTCQKYLNFILYKTPDSVSVRSVDNLSSAVDQSEVQLQCDITNVAPAQNLIVRWYRGNETFGPLINGSSDSMRVTGCLPKNNTNCKIGMIRSPLNVSSTITITFNKTYPVAEFRCEAQLDLGPEGPQLPPNVMSSPVNISVYYKPIINTTKLSKTIPVFRGYPEELICEADGHPTPKIQWLYSPDLVPHLSENKLIVSEAGFYNCSATNEVGSNSYEVEVILKEDYLPLIAGFVAVTVVAISIIFLFIYSIYYKNTRMRRYSLKNPKLNTHNGNVAHNGWDLQFPMTKLS